MSIRNYLIFMLLITTAVVCAQQTSPYAEKEAPLTSDDEYQEDSFDCVLEALSEQGMFEKHKGPKKISPAKEFCMRLGARAFVNLLMLRSHLLRMMQLRSGNVKKIKAQK